MAFQGSGFYGVTIGVHAKNYNDISNDVINVMEKSDFRVVKEETIESCKGNIESGATHLCISFPEDFETGKLIFYVDYSRLNLVYAIVNKITSEIDDLVSKLSLDNTQDILDFLADTATNLNASTKLIDELKNNTGNLRDQLNLIGFSVDNLSLGNSDTMLNDLLNDSSEINLNLKTAKQDINSLSATLTLIKSQGKTTQDDLKKTIDSVKAARTAEGCTSENSRDLSNYLTNGKFVEELAKESYKTCSLLLTFEKSAEAQEDNLVKVLGGIDQLISYLTSMKTEITNLESSMKSQANLAKGSLTNLDLAKENLSMKLYQLAGFTNESIEVFENMTLDLNGLVGTFNDISMTDADTVLKPIKTLIKPLSSKKINTLDILYPSILVMIIMFVGILMGNILIMREKTSKAYFRNLILPAKPYVFILGTYLTTALITLLQVAVIILIGVIFFGTNLDFNIFRLLPLLLATIVLFSSIGMVIGYLAGSEETSIMASIILSLIFLLFSNMIIPIETMAEGIGIIARMTPFNIAEMLLRRTLVFGSDAIGSNAFAPILFIVQMIGLVVAVLYSHKYAITKKR